MDNVEMIELHRPIAPHSGPFQESVPLMDAYRYLACRMEAGGTVERRYMEARDGSVMEIVTEVDRNGSVETVYEIA